MKKLALIIAVLGMLGMSASAFAGGSATPLSDQQLDLITAAGGDDDDSGHGYGYNGHGYGSYFDGVNMSGASGLVLIGMAVNSNLAVQINMSIINGGNSGSITGTNTVNP